MTDCWGREIHYLRLSVTDRCNLRCRYCMPQEGVDWLDHQEILTYEEMVRMVRVLAGLGIDRVRLTGGEPLVRRELEKLVAGIKAVPGIRWVGLTTNGLLLEEQLPALVKAGLDGVNISLDTLDRGQYETITGQDALDRALAGLNAARAVSGLQVKVNCVPMMENRDQWVPLAELAREEPSADVRFIEMMPIGQSGNSQGCREDEVLSRLEAAFGPAVPCEEAAEGGPGRYVRFNGFAGRIGFISAMSRPFCSACNRVRLTSTGVLKPCLQYGSDLDLKGLLRSGLGDEILSAVLMEAIYQKPAAHHFGGAPAPGDETHNMNQIGG